MLLQPSTTVEGLSVTKKTISWFEFDASALDPFPSATPRMKSRRPRKMQIPCRRCWNGYRRVQGRLINCGHDGTWMLARQDEYAAICCKAFRSMRRLRTLRHSLNSRSHLCSDSNLWMIVVAPLSVCKVHASTIYLCRPALFSVWEQQLSS